MLEGDGSNTISIDDFYEKFPEVEQSHDLSTVLSSLPKKKKTDKMIEVRSLIALGIFWCESATTREKAQAFFSILQPPSQN